ncbi:LysM peptidoglycan-binding domain-containing protein [Bradyrhizobium sp. Tv2a-2]|uniref:LysM peptidoglycan-binding domain-containing protein n=1 Tax=Bradyrhizobium sp. Tv2a-2 TaxID=113395 RepID=UPI001FD88E60|nr:LysM peptidoglycan-binding domain-containing protein [Bradyrhizobium sp. Tv2a-2]
MKLNRAFPRPKATLIVAAAMLAALGCAQSALAGSAAPIRQTAVHRTDANAAQAKGTAAATPAPDPAPIVPRGRVYLFRGALGPIFSTGMDRLAEKIVRAGLPADTYEFTICPLIASRAIDKYREDPQPIILIGHSMGGRCALQFSEKLQEENIPVSLVVTIDPAHLSPSVPTNVERFINIFLSKNVLGGGDIKPVTGFPGHYASYDLEQHDEVSHITIDKMDSVHQQLIAKILALAATPAKTNDEIAQLRYAVPPEEPIELWDSGMVVAARPGDTLQTLAQQYQLPLWALTQANPMPDNAPLVPGQRVIVPRHLAPAAPATAAAVAGPVATRR